MKKKSILATAAGAMAVGLGMVSAPSTQQVIEQTQTAGQITVQQQQANQQRNIRSQQQAQQRTSQNVRVNTLTNPYAPIGGGGLLYGASYSMTPKEYGEWLMRTGKDKYNKRCHKHWAKARS